MTITTSLRDEDAKSRSITDAIDGLAIAMGGGIRTVSTRQNTDATGRVVGQTAYTTSGTAVSVKRSERNTGGGKSASDSIVYDGQFWNMTNSNGAEVLKIDLICEDFEKVTVRVSANGTEAGVGDLIRIVNTSSGGEVNYSISTSNDFTFIGLAGESYTLEIICGGSVGSFSNGSLIIDYMPELAQAIKGDPFSGAWGASAIPTYFGDFIPKLLPSAVITRSGGPAVFSTTFSFRFADGLRPWFPYPTNYVHRVAMVIKYVGIDISPTLGITDIFVSVLEYDGSPGVGTAISLEEQWSGIVPNGLWPSMVSYFEVDAGSNLANGAPCSVNLIVSHGAGAYFPSVPTLGYFIVEGKS